jgi:[glutamine synthetase] adenylyltransferase / [glutamine synthetase]-adenylyl-L-tyrosine phosphorylase
LSYLSYLSYLLRSMISAESKQAIESLCPEVGKDVIHAFFERMDEDYFATFSAEEISTHIKMSCALDVGRPAQCLVTPREPDEFDIVIVGFDYLSEFSVFCGLLSAFGLDIRAGNVYSFARREPGEKPPRLGRRARRGKALQSSPRKIVDVFNTRLRPGENFDEAKRREFEQELQTLVRMLASGSLERARERLDRFLTERIEKMNEPLTGLLSDVEVRFDNVVSPDWTVMDAHSEDAFAFLYAFSNALSIRGVYIHKVEIRSVGQEARDRFFIADRRLRKIVDGREQERLRTTVALIKRFTRFLPEAPDPAKAMRHFDQFLDKVAEERIPDRMVSFFAGREGMNLLAHLLGSSDFLWDDFLRVRFKDLLPILEDFTKTELRPGKQSLRQRLAGCLPGTHTFEEKKEVFNRFKDSQVFLIDVKHLFDPQVTLMDFSQALTDLAEVALDEAAGICYERLIASHGEPARDDGSTAPFTICGLGKFGGREMGYASDLEVLFVHDGPGRTRGAKPIDNGLFFERLAQQVVEFIEAREKGVFHLDLRLRPHGKAGALATPFERLANYYSKNGDAAPFERQALIKLRWVAGDEVLGRRVEECRDRFTYSGEPWDRENAMRLRRRQADELVKPGRINVKYSHGGIIDIEYAAQYLQLLHGKDHPELRVTGTLKALDGLRRLNLISETESETLRAAYLFLRGLIDALRIVRGDASDLDLPEEGSEEFKSLARRLGYRERDWKIAAAALAADIRRWMKEVNSYYAARFLNQTT